MRISKIVCDGCGRVIEGDPIKFFAEKVDRETGDFTSETGAALYAPDKDFCDECHERIKNFIETLCDKEEPAAEEPDENEVIDVAELIEKGLPTVLTEEPTVEVVNAPEEKEEAVVEKPKVEAPKAPEQPPKGKQPTVRDLILQGVSREEVIRQTGCVPATYNQTKYQLKKQGLLPMGETVRCSEAHRTCKYAGSKSINSGMCDYIGITGQTRGCPAEECDKYERRKK